MAGGRTDGAIVTAPSAIVGSLASAWTVPTRRVHGTIGALALGAAIVVLGYLAVALSPAGSSVAAWWPAAGVAVAAVTTRWSSRRSLLGAIAVATLLANLAGGRPAAVAAGFAVSNTAEVWVVAAWLHRVGRDGVALRRIADVVLFVVGAAIGALTIGVGATLTIVLFGQGDPLSTFANVVPSHLTAVLVIAPLVTAPRAPISRSPIEHVTSWVLTAVSTIVVFWPGQALPLAFVPSVVMIWSAIRLGLRSTAAQLTMVTITVTVL